MMKICASRWLGLFALAASAVAAVRVSASEAVLRPYVVEWPAHPQSPADVSFLVKGPAGRDGFIRSQGGHFVLPDGHRLRFWGVNLTMQAGLPAKEHAPTLAANLARVGVNCVRFHFLDRPAPTGILASNRNDTRALDLGQLDRLDFLIAEFKQRGIYADLNLNVGRSYKVGDGVRDYELLGYAKSLTYFDPRLLELQREYARQLLTHRNPYTQTEYRQEAAVALIEFVNENSLVEAWADGRLQGNATNRFPGTWTDIPASYAAALTAKYNAWLKEHYSTDTLAQWRQEANLTEDTPVPRLKPAQFAKASQARFQAEASFYLEVERAFFTGMQQFLREELGVKPLFVGNSDHGHHRTGYPQLAGASLLDVVDGHVYWQHPHYLTDPKTGRQTGFDIPNTPMVNDPLQSSVVQLSRSAFAAKPFTVSEVNHPFPHEYACEGIPILAAYAALQDWDGIFWYSLGHRDMVSAPAKLGGHFDLGPDPVKMCQLAAGALLFARGDVQPARRTLERNYNPEQVRESLRLPWNERPYFTPGFPLSLPLQSGVRIRSLSDQATGPFEIASAFPIRSDTGELAWFLGADKKGLVTLNTPRSQAIVGFSGATKEATENLALDLETPFSAVTLGALDAEPIARSGKLLLTACARIANANLQWNEKRTSLTDWGAAPTVIEPVTGRVLLRNLTGATRVSAQALDGGGQPLGPRQVAEKTDAGWRLSLGEPTTTWFVVQVER